MRRIIALPAFDRSIKKLTSLEKSQLIESLDQFKVFVYRGIAPVGLGFKKISEDIYEFRVGLRLRVVVLAEGDDYYLAPAGNHDEIKKYLRRYR